MVTQLNSFCVSPIGLLPNNILNMALFHTKQPGSRLWVPWHEINARLHYIIQTKHTAVCQQSNLRTGSVHKTSKEIFLSLIWWNKLWVFPKYQTTKIWCLLESYLYVTYTIYWVIISPMGIQHLLDNNLLVWKTGVSHYGFHHSQSLPDLLQFNVKL